MLYAWGNLFCIFKIRFQLLSNFLITQTLRTIKVPNSPFSLPKESDMAVAEIANTGRLCNQIPCAFFSLQTIHTPKQRVQIELFCHFLWSQCNLQIGLFEFWLLWKEKREIKTMSVASVLLEKRGSFTGNNCDVCLCLRIQEMSPSISWLHGTKAWCSTRKLIEYCNSWYGEGWH